MRLQLSVEVHELQGDANLHLSISMLTYVRSATCVCVWTGNLVDVPHDEL